MTFARETENRDCPQVADPRANDRVPLYFCRSTVGAPSGCPQLDGIRKTLPGWSGFPSPWLGTTPRSDGTGTGVREGRSW